MRPGVFERPWLCWGLGLAVFPLGKLLILPNIFFNLLVTLVHETGHTAAFWFMGLPAVPKISLAGDGGLTQTFGEPSRLLAVGVMVALAGAAFYTRERKPVMFALIGVLVIYPFLAFSADGPETVGVAGGVALEIVGSAYCFIVCLRANFKRPFERPLYAMVGWWMLANRTAETFLMLTNSSYRNDREIINSTLAAGLTHDLLRLPDLLGVSSNAVLIGVLALCVLVVPGSALYAWRRPRVEDLDRSDEI